jgi:hypothetical protein
MHDRILLDMDYVRRREAQGARTRSLRNSSPS